MSQHKITRLLQGLEPQERLKQLINYSNTVEVDSHVPPMRYYRSGIEMVRMANVYYQEGSLENAYVLYLKFMTLFLEKIRKHPEFNSVPVDVKARNQCKLREILPKAEKLKQELLEHYKDDYNSYVAEVKQRQKEELEKKKNEPTKKSDKPKPSSGSRVGYSIPSIAKVPSSIANVNYPDSVSNIPGYPPPSAPPAPPSTIVPQTRHEDVPMPIIDRTNKPSEISIKERYDTTVLRRVIVPVKVMTLFQTMAQHNTLQNVETCGVLTGKLASANLVDFL